jgi:hypothetical protein
VLLVDRSRHADQDEVGRVERLDPVGQGEAVARQVLLEVLTLGLSSSASPARILCRRAAEMSIPMIRQPAPHRDRRRQADVAEADDRDDRVSGVGSRWGNRGRHRHRRRDRGRFCQCRVDCRLRGHLARLRSAAISFS